MLGFKFGNPYTKQLQGNSRREYVMNGLIKQEDALPQVTYESFVFWW